MTSLISLTFTLVICLISEESPLAWSHFGNISRVCQRPPTQGAGVDLNLTRPSSYCGHYVFAVVVAPSGCSSPTLDRLYTPTTWYGTKPSMYTINYDANPQYPLQQINVRAAYDRQILLSLNHNKIPPTLQMDEGLWQCQFNALDLQPALLAWYTCHAKNGKWIVVSNK